MEPVSRESYRVAESYRGAESYQLAVERLEGFATGDRPVALAGVADEVLSVAQLLQVQPRLRRALSDPARTGEDRAELLGSLLHGKVSDDTEALMRVLVAGRWSSANALLDAAERLGVEGLLASAESAGDLADVEDELFRFGQIVDGDSRLVGALGATSVPPEQRSELAHSLLEGKAKPATIRLVDVALHGFGGRNFSASLARLVELAAARRDRQVAYVTAAVPLTDAEEERLAARLGQLYGRTIAVKVTVDPSIIGGLSVQIGHDRYDGTVARRIANARAALTGSF